MAADLSGKPASAVAASLSRCSYFVYLYHGFFLDRDVFGPESTWVRAPLVVALALGLGEVVAAGAKPDVASTYFGIPPPRKTGGKSAL